MPATGTPALPPMGWTQFNLGVPRTADLYLVNNRVNRRIQGVDADATKPWRIIYADVGPFDGCCHDYAVTKRAELLGLGWPASRLLLCEVAYDDTENHMVLRVETDAGTFVLDNLRDEILTWGQAGYVLKRMQSRADPSLWVAP